MTFDRALLEAELTRDEGRRNKPYLDSVGKITIGIGHNLSENGITDAEIEQLLDEDIRRAQADLDKCLPWWRNLGDVRQRVMINLCFNMGIGGLMTFHNTLRAIQAGDWPAASYGLLASEWAGQVGARASRLAEAMRTGKMPA